MVKKEELFVLIKSLSRSEKRYFKLYNTHNNASANYLKLFDAIEQQDAYDETLIKKKFKNETFIKQLHVTKNYLHNMILASLRSFHADISKDAELKDCLRNVEVLFHKELYKLCERQLNRAEALAEQYELYTAKMEVLNWQRKLKQAQEPHNYNAFYNYVDAQQDVLNVLQNGIGYWKNMVMETWQTMGSNPPNEKLTKLKAPVTLQSKVLRYNTAYIKYLRTGNNKKGEQELVKLIELLELYPERLKEEPASYVSTINNLVSYMVFSKRDKEAIELINKAKQTYEQFRITTEKRSMLKQILRTYNLELEIYRNRKTIDKRGFTFINETEQFVIANKNKIPKDYLLSFWFQLANIHFRHGNYDKALSWLNNILNNKFGEIRSDLQTQARMLNILVHFEQKNYFVLRYFVDSTRRFIKKRRPVEEYEEILLKFFTRMSSVHEYERRKQYRLLSSKLFPDAATIVPDGVLDYVDYRSWLKNKAG